MKRISFTILVAALLTGCSSNESEFKEVTSTTNEMVTPETTPAPESQTQEPANSPLFDVKSIASKSEKDVTALLGKPSDTENGNWTLMPSGTKTPYVANYYAIKAGTLGVMFIDGKAARITLELVDGSGFKYPGDAAKVVAAFGIKIDPTATPNTEAANSVTYLDVDGFSQATVVQGLADKPDSVREVKVVTEEKYR